MKPLDYLLYAAVIFGWSTRWLPLKWQLGVIAPEVSLFWRFCLASALMFLVTKLFTNEKIALAWRDHLLMLPLGCCLFSVNFTLFYYGGLNTTSGLLAVVFSTASLINIFYMAILDRKMPKLPLILAGLIGFFGVGLIYSPELEHTTGGIGLLFCLAGTLVFSTGNMLSSRYQNRKFPVMATTAWGMFYGAIILGLISLLRGHEFSVEHTYQYLGGLVWLAVISSVLAFTAYLTLLGRIGPERAGYATVVFPVGALLISTVVEGYQWSLVAFLGLAFVLVGNIVMLRSR